MGIVALIAIFTTRLLLEGLGVEDYGVYNVTMGIISLCSFLQPALANGIQRFFNVEIGKSNLYRAKCVFNTSVQIQLIVSLLIVVLCETIGQWYVMNKFVVAPERYEATLIIYQISILAMVVAMMQVPFMAVIIAYEKMDFFALISVVDAVLKLVIAFVLRFSQFDHLILYSMLLLCITLLNFFIYAYYAIKNFPEIRIHCLISKDLFRDMLSFSGWNLLEKFARLGKDQGLNIMLNYYFSPIVNAARGVIGQVTAAFTGLVDSTVTASRPQSIQSYARGDYQRTLNIMFSLSKFVLLLLYLCVFPVYLEAPYILNLWLGDNVPELTIPLLNIALITIIVDKLAMPISVVVHATGKMKLFNIVSGIMNIAVIPFSIYALSQGADAVIIYWIVFGMTLVTQIVLVFTLRKLIKFSIMSYYKEVVCRSLIVIAFSLWLPWLAYSVFTEGFFRLVVVLLSSFFVTTFFAYVIGLSDAERSLCKGVVESVIKKMKR